MSDSSDDDFFSSSSDEAGSAGNVAAKKKADSGKDDKNMEKNAALNATKKAVAPTNIGNFLNPSNI